jgi:hypothetical protein
MSEVCLKPKVCNLCGGEVIYTTNKIIYGKEYGNGKIYYCVNCHAYVGTHKDEPQKALGILADHEMRELKIKCHELFDKRWKESENKSKARKEQYVWLSERMGIPLKECHFGWFDKDQLLKAISILNEE